jgi:hypothetical protein
MPKNDGSPTIYERAKARDLAATNDATLTMHDAAIMRGQAATRAREANERQQAARRIAAQERARAHAILSHEAVVSGRARQLAHFLLFETDMSVAEAHAALSQAHAGDETKVHPSGGLYEMGAQAAEHLLHPIERDRRAKQALNDAAFAEANFGSVYVDRRTPREKQRDEQFADIARGCQNRDDTTSPNQPGNRKAENDDSDDDADLRAMGFGGGAQLDRGTYEAGAANASRLLGKSSPTTARLPGNAAYVAGRPAPAIPAASPSLDASYAAGAESAKRLLGTGAIKAELDSDLRAKFAEQQARRASN